MLIFLLPSEYYGLRLKIPQALFCMRVQHADKKDDLFIIVVTFGGPKTVGAKLIKSSPMPHILAQYTIIRILGSLLTKLLHSEAPNCLLWDQLQHGNPRDKKKLNNPLSASKV